jgi:hypothetical protein
MKSILFSFIVILSCFSINAQVKISTSTTAPNANAILDIESTSKGLLLPRLSLTSTSSASPMAAHTAGMVVYNTATASSGSTVVTPGYYYNSGSTWLRITTTFDETWLPSVSGGHSGMLLTTGASTRDSVFVSNNGQVLIGNTLEPSDTANVNGARLAINDSGDFRTGVNAKANYTLPTSNTTYDLMGVQGQANHRSSNVPRSITGVYGKATTGDVGSLSSGTIPSAFGVKGLGRLENGSAIVTNIYGGDFSASALASTNARATNVYGVNIGSIIDSTMLGSSTLPGLNRYGLYVNNVVRSTVQPGGSTFSIYTNNGLVSIGDNIEQRGKGYFKVAAGTTEERPTSPLGGMIRFNTTTGRFEGFNGTIWENLD